MTDNSTPKVFISYSWSSKAHEDFVVRFCKELLNKGIDVVLDKWHLKPGNDKYAFMEKMVNDDSIDKVLIISDKTYTEKANRRKGGVGTESQIISKEMYEKINQEKFIPVVVEYDEQDNATLPTFLASRIYIDLSPSSDYLSEFEKLVRIIHNEPELIKPEVGTKPDFSTKPIADSSLEVRALGKFINTAHNNPTDEFSTMIEYFEAQVIFLEDHLLVYNEETHPDNVYSSVLDLKSSRDMFLQLLETIIKKHDEDKYYQAILDHFENLATFHYPNDGSGVYNRILYDNIRYYTQMSFTYFITFLIKYHKPDIVDLVLNHSFYVKNRPNSRHISFTEFQDHNQTLDQLYVKKHNLDTRSLFADIAKEQADVCKIEYEELMQTDFILALRSVFSGIQRYWFPNLIVHRRRWSAWPFEIFDRAQAERHFIELSIILQFANKADLVQKYEKAYEDYGLDNWKWGHDRIPFKDYMNLENLFDA